MHIQKDAPDGKIYHYKKEENEFAFTIYLGEGRTLDDYELIPLSKYERIMEEKHNQEQII